MDSDHSEEQGRAASAPESLVDTAMQALREVLQVAEASLALLRAELRLARSSALTLVWLGFALVFFGVGAWLAASVAIALGVEVLSGSLLLGVCVVAAANLGGAAWVVYSMRRCWRDLSLPRTRALVVSTHPAASSESTAAVRDPQSEKSS